MKALLTYLVLFLTTLISVSQLAAQTNGDLVLKNKFWSGQQVYDGSQKLSKSAVEQKLSVVPEALALYKKGKSQNSQASIIAAFSGFGIGYGVGTMINKNKDGGGAYLAAGVGLGVIGGIMAQGANAKITSALSIYNKSNAMGYKEPKLILGVGQHGLGLALNF